MVTKDPPATVYAWYKAVVAQRGWTLSDHRQSSAETSQRFLMITATKDNNHLTISCTRTMRGDTTLININSMAVPQATMKK